MRRKIWSFVLIVSMLLVLMPDTAMAAKMEGQSLQIRTTAVRTEKEETEQTEKETGEQRPAKTETAGSSLQLEGEGTQAAPYRIKNGEQLRAFADMVNGGVNTGVCAVLACDIDLSGVCGADIGSWTPIGTKANPYTGSFDGGSFAVTGLYYHKSGSSYAGLFGYNSGVIKNLGVTGADIVAGSYAGGVCGFNNGTITGCYHAASVKGDKYTGGVCGYNGDGGTVSVCHNTGVVNGSKYVGGVCGYNKSETSSCYNTGTVNGTGTSVGGVCGYNKKLLLSCYNTGEVNGGGKDYVGSICGYNHSEGTLSNCYYLVTGTEKGNYGTAVTQEQFASGEVCWLLNEGKSDSGVWRQSCGSGLPTFGGKVVYQVKQRKANETVVAYSNEKKPQVAPSTASSTVSAQSNDSGSYTEENSGGHIYQEPEWKWKKYDSAKAVFTCLDCGEELTLKASISKEETKATCTEAGETIYTASVERDGVKFKDEKAVAYQKSGHKDIKEIKDKVDPTCEEPGYKDHCFVCSACGKCFNDKDGKESLPQKDYVVPALGHNYGGEPRWTWNMENNPPVATATFSCSRCPEGKAVKGKVTVQTPASCKDSGKADYKAVVTFDGKPYENKAEGQTVPHSYGKPTRWEWEKDYSAAKAVFNCKECLHEESREAVLSSIRTQESTCRAVGNIKHTAVVTLGGKEYKESKNQTLQKVDHSYREPSWQWVLQDKTATATFKCIFCSKSVSLQADITAERTQGTGCGVAGKAIYTARVMFDGNSYENKTPEISISGDHALSYFAAKPATCEETGNEQYWYCGCGKMFKDAAGKVEILTVPVIPKTDHTPVKESDGKFRCAICGQLLSISTTSDTTTTVDSSDDGTMITDSEAETEETPVPGETKEPDQENQDPVQNETGDEEEPGGENSDPVQNEPGDEETPSTENQDPVKEENPGGESQEPVQGQPGGENQETAPGGTDQEPVQNEQGGENQGPVQNGAGGENQETLPGEPDGESGEAAVNALEDAARYGLIYPEGIEAENDSMAQHTWEETAFHLRADSSENGMAQAKQEQQGVSLWISVAVLAVLAGAVLFFVLRRKNN